MKKRYGKTVLFITAMLWGSTFAIGKIATEVFSPAFIIALRFSIATVALVIFAFPLLKKADKQYWIDGTWMGAALFASYLLQVGGLAGDTTPGESAFLCTTYCVLVPFFHWFATKKRPEWLHVICVFICLMGIGIISLKDGLSMSGADILTVLSGIPGAMNIVLSSIKCKNKNPLLLTTIELGVVSVLAWGVVLFSGGYPTEFPTKAVTGIVYLGLIATALCLFNHEQIFPQQRNFRQGSNHGDAA